MDRSKWEYKKLGEVATFERGLTYSKNDESDSSTKGVLRSNNIDLDSHQLVFDEIKYLNESFEIPKSKKLVKDSIFICMSNGSKAHLGKVAYVDKDYDYAFGGFMGVIKPHNIYPKYLFYYFLSKEYRDGLEQIGKGANINNLRFAQLANFIIPDPSKDDQQRIVAELDCLNEMIALKQKQLKEFDKLAQSIFYDMFGDPMDNVHEWGISILEDVVSDSCSISYGIVQPGEDVENGVPVVRPVDLVNQVVYKDGLKIVDKAISDSYKRTILKGDELLFCVRGTTGIISFASEELEGCNVTRGITPLEFGDRIDKYYAYYLLKTPYLQSLIAEKTNGIALKQINMRDVRLLPVMCPPFALQQQFAEKIQAIEAQKELVKQSIAETQQLLDSRMDYYFN